METESVIIMFIENGEKIAFLSPDAEGKMQIWDTRAVSHCTWTGLQCDLFLPS